MPRSRQPTLPASPRWLVRGDLDGFLGLALDNLIQILLIIALCRGVLGYPDELIFGVILPAAGLSLLVGNGAYAIQAHRLARLEGRDDRTALPYGINTVSLFAYVFLVMLPVKLAALGEGLSAEQAVQLSWRAGMLACLGSGLIEAGGAFCVGALRRWLPRAALLSTLAGIALGYIGLGFLLRTYAVPVVGLAVLAVILMAYYGNVRLPLPGGLLAVLVGIALAWATGLLQVDSTTWQANAQQVGWRLRGPSAGSALGRPRPAAALAGGDDSRWGCSTCWVHCRTSRAPRRPAMPTRCGVPC
jgi:AGZA family xanthine/uracil permease-like MFS transporter